MNEGNKYHSVTHVYHKFIEIMEIIHFKIRKVVLHIYTEHMERSKSGDGYTCYFKCIYISNFIS